MRLTHLKLAGFKSFVDPTIIHLHGQRVGVVGPNGCGKSNVMESVRWVLGESSAKEMRADAMDAVIFNGSGNRKPISRASVELIFDNSLSSAAGAWSQYAEISVKRVIEREKGSTYYINNTAVRRRDVADLFLGTGLGGRAYAIIGQNTISRIVEAKPEELRVFLEEAAGISKYKERRRETELRLRDTRENLIRVEDICRELQKKITKLESQAVIAQQYHLLQASYKLAEGQLWLLKKRDASRNWEKAKLLVEQLVNQLEAQMAALRKSEAELELSRQTHYAAAEGINSAQAAYYEANAEVSDLENQVKQHSEARERMSQQLHQLALSLERNATNDAALQQNLVQLNSDLKSAQINAQESNQALTALKLTLPEKEAFLKTAETLAQTSLQALNEANQRLQLEGNNIQFINKNIKENQHHIQRFESELTNLIFPNESDLKASEVAWQQAQKIVSAIEKNSQLLRANEVNYQAEMTQLRDLQNMAQRELNQADAEMQSLQKLQQSLHSETKLNDWLARYGLKDCAYLWQKMKINASWRVAVEAVLGAKLNALIANNRVLANNIVQQRPPGALVLGFGGLELATALTHQTKLTPLISVIENCDADLKPVLTDWLQGAYLMPFGLLPAEDALESAISKLNLGEILVNQQGDIFSCHSVCYHSAQSSLHGVLERQAQLLSLEKNQPNIQKNWALASQNLKHAENQLQVVRQQQQQENTHLHTATQQQHQLQLKLSQLQQTRQNALERQKNIQIELAALNQKLAQLMRDEISKQALQLTIMAQIQTLTLVKNQEHEAKKLAEQACFVLRDAIAQAEKNNQENGFNLTLVTNKISEINNKINVNNEEKSALNLRQKEIEQTLILTPMDTLKANLIEAINTKQSCESALAYARNHLTEQEHILQTFERVRMQNEQQLHPLRDGVEQQRLLEQEARLAFEQCHIGLVENGQDEQMLSSNLNPQVKVSDLARKASQIQQEITDLGAVNLAAIQELSSETERKTYLDSQMLDLRQATQTLEDAIRKIDLETRDKLMNTFNTANQHFGELFATLFGGGQARLELLGDEILDTGLHVFAQPPGKKNTTIQLLSGGEKALTALALVFALFRLNPAPFCLMDEVDAPLDDSNTERFCHMVKKMSENTQFLFVSHNKITMEMAQQLIGVTMQESGVSRVVDVDIDAALTMQA